MFAEKLYIGNCIIRITSALNARCKCVAIVPRNTIARIIAGYTVIDPTSLTRVNEFIYIDKTVIRISKCELFRDIVQTT